MSIRETYHQFEDGWYNFLDAVDTKIPVYAVVDPIERVVPTFAVLLGIIAVLLVGGGYYLITGGSASSATILVLDEDGKPVEGVVLQATWENNGKQDAVTNAVGKATFTGIPLATTIQVRAEHPLFSDKTSTYTLNEKNSTLSLTLSLAKAVPTLLTFYFVDKTGMSLEGKPLTIQLACSSGEPVEGDAQPITSGVLRTTPPEDCGTLLGTISGEGFETRAGIPLRSESPIIALDSRALEKSQVKIRVTHEEDGKGIGGILVELVSREGETIEQNSTNALGVVQFENIPEGEYYASASSPTGEFAAQTTLPFTLDSPAGEEMTVTLSRATQGSLLVNVTDSITGGALSNVTLKLLRQTDRSVVQTLSTSESTPAKLSVNEKGPFILYVLHADYLSAEKQIPTISGETSVGVALEKLTPQNSGRVSVKVTDEDGLAVDNARVVLYDAASKFIAHAYAPRFTNASGEAIFYGVKSGNYFARATKYPAGPSDSPLFSSSVNEATQTTVKMTIGNATVRVRVLDEQGEPIALASVQFDAEGSSECSPNKCRVETDAGGIASYTFKADRKIFARIAAPGYVSYETISHALKAGLPSTIPVVLPRSIPGNAPQLTIASISDALTGLPATQLDKGKSYRVLFQVRIPDALSGLETAGAFVRVGNEARVENEHAFILSTNAPRARTMRGSTYQPDAGWEEDQQNLTDGDAKWATIEWNAAQTGVYEFSTTLHVKNDTPLLEEIALHYRAWGKQGSIWTRTPVDSILGENENAAGKESLYAETFTQTYFAGKTLACGDVVCYAGETLTNLETGMVQRESPYAAIPLNAHRYTFILSGNATSNQALSNAHIRVISTGENGTSGGPVIESYAFERVPGDTIQESGLSTFTLEGSNGQGIGVGDISSTQTIAGTIDFLGASDATSEMVVQVISAGDVVFERTLSFTAGGFQNFQIQATPSSVPAFADATLSIRVIDEEGFGVAGVRVRATKIDASNTQTIAGEKYTDNLGNVLLAIPASLPNTRFQIDATRGSESAAPILVGVGTNVVDFSPTILDAALDAVPNADTFVSLDATSLAQQELILTQTSIAGAFQGLLSLNDMQNWLEQYHGNLRISPGETQGMNVKVSTTPSLSLLTGKNLSGNIITVWENTLNAGTWVQSIPLNVALGIPTQCDEAALQLTGVSNSGTIELTAFENRVDKPFQLLNVCEVNGNPVNLHNLTAKITWRSAPIGSVELSMQNPTTGERVAEALQNGFPTPLFDTVNTAQQTPYDAVLTFTPQPGHVGEKAEFTVTLSAQTGQGNDTQIISESFDLRIMVTNFETCITYDIDRDAGLIMNEEDAETQFSIDTTACGNVPIDIAFCTGANNVNCSGGAPQGKIYLSQYAITALKGEKTIRVERKSSTLPGTYDITVDARVPGTSMRRVAALPLVVQPREDYAFVLGKSSFTLLPENPTDTAEVTNRLVDEKITVRASICDWDDSNKRDSENVAEELAVFSAGIFTYFAFHDFDIENAWKAFWDLFDDPCDEYRSRTLTDFVIKLRAPEGLRVDVPGDAIDVKLSSNISSAFSAEWVVDDASLERVDEKWFEHAGLRVRGTNTTPRPAEFGVMTLRATEHIHGDAFHSGNAAVRCENDNFGKFLVGSEGSQGDCSGAYDTVREEKYHIKLTTSPGEEPIVLNTFDAVACTSPTGAGYTGTGALPKVNYTWEWNDNTGVTWNFCDASNPNAVYCDATQFNIMMQKRLKRLDNFLAANQYTFDCPSGLGTQPDSQVFVRPTPVPTGFVGYHSFGYTFQSPTTLSFAGTIENASAATHDTTMRVTLTPIPGSGSGNNSPGNVQTCDATISIPANTSAPAGCAISSIPAGTYVLVFDLVSTTTSNIATIVNSKVIDTQEFTQSFGQTCEGLVKTTMLINGKPGINRWIDRTDPVWGATINDNPVFTNEVPTIEALRQLMHFEAYLMKDGYTIDFENDFRDYYSTSAFADSPTWFKSSGAGAAGMNAYYGSDDALVFTQKYVNDSTLSSSGKYRVNIEATFMDDWRLLDASGSPSARVRGVFYHTNNPTPDSPLYDLPLNGRVGELNGEYQRVGYGVEYVDARTANSSTSILSTQAPIQTSESSSGVSKLTIQEPASVATLNSLPSTRGSVLNVGFTPQTNEAELQFNPSYATPLVLKISHPASDNPFSAFYQLTGGNSPVSTGNTLTYWEAGGNCYDYTGVPLYQRFNYSPDRAAASADHLPTTQGTYGLDWPRAVSGGDVYLRTIIYTPANQAYAFQTRSANARAFTPNAAAPSTVQTLSGVSSMAYNNASSPIQTLADVFTLVKNNQMCVSNSGTQTKFFWNPAAVYTQPGQVNVSTFVNGLVAGQTCLGPAT